MTEIDLAAQAQVGQVLRTRDRREVTVTAIDAATGRISGSVPMVGPCQWLRNGRYAAAPGGNAGPLDLMPARETTQPPEQKHASLQEVLGDPAAKNACCD